MTAAPSLGLPLGNGRFVRAANRSDVLGVQWYRGKEAWKRARGSSRRIHTFYMCVYVYAYTYLYIKWRDLWVAQEFGVHGDVLRGVSKHPEPSCEPLEVSERGAATKKEVTACGRNDYGQCNLASAVPCGRRPPSRAELIEELLGSFVSEAEDADPQPNLDLCNLPFPPPPLPFSPSPHPPSLSPCSSKVQTSCLLSCTRLCGKCGMTQMHWG